MCFSKPSTRNKFLRLGAIASGLLQQRASLKPTRPRVSSDERCHQSTRWHGNVTEARLREMIEALSVAIYITDAEGRLTYFNAAAAKLSGRVPELGVDQGCVAWRMFLCRMAHRCRTTNPH